MDARKDLPRIVIIGAGFGGLRAARAFAGKPVNVTLVDRNNYHLFQPLLYQIATSTLSPDEIAYPVRGSLRGRSNVQFHLGQVQSIDLPRKCVISDTARQPYDYLILAVGGETNFYGLDSVKQNAFGLKDLEDATHIRNHLLDQFELAVSESDPQKRAALLTFVIVGGGPTGVECSGAISELVRMVLHKDYPTLNVDDVRVLLLEASDRIMGHMPADLGEVTARVLRRKHVELHTQTAVADYDGQVVSLKDGRRIPACTLIWAAGVRASHLLDSLGLEQDRMGRVKVGNTLQVPGHPEIFVIGDAASLAGADGNLLPMVAPVAMQQASSAVENILRVIEGKPALSFTYRDPGIMATIGRNQAVVHVGRWKVHGFLAWLMWLGVHIYQLIGFRNRLAVLLDWAWSYLFYEHAARIIGPT
jgi:NADH:ubiquinone reductase (H+-translocating)